jgi:hypothetical protein
MSAISKPKMAAITPITTPNKPPAKPMSAPKRPIQRGKVSTKMMINKMVEEELEELRVVIGWHFSTVNNNHSFFYKGIKRAANADFEMCASFRLLNYEQVAVK